MRTTQLIACALASAVSADSITSPTAAYQNPCDKYPNFPHPPDRTAIPYGRRAARTATKNKTPAYWGMRAVDNCTYPLEILILQDVTDSFNDDIVEMYNVQLGKMLSGLSTMHPGSKVNVASFRDKPLDPFGESGEDGIERDFCWALSSGNFTDSLSQLQSEYQLLRAGGGDDYPEAQYHAIFGAMQSPSIGWGMVEDAQQLIVLSTDAAPHYDGDGSSMQSMVKFSGEFDDADPNGQCVREFYPTADQAVGVTMQPVYGQTDLPFFAFLIYDGSYPTPNFTTNAWRWYSDAIGEPNEHFVNDINANSSNFWDKLAVVISEMDSINCNNTDTTTSTWAHTDTTVTTTTSPTTTSTWDHTTETTTTTTPTTTAVTTTSPCHLRHNCTAPCDDIRIRARVPVDAQMAIINVDFN